MHCNDCDKDFTDSEYVYCPYCGEELTEEEEEES
jgi:rRNA maturation endonuclease Nob1